MHGGYARHPSMTTEGFIIAACHEVGHHLGNENDNFESLNTIEGEADYFVTAKCFRRYAASDDNQAIIRGMVIPALVKERCEAVYTDAEEAAICQRAAMGGLSITRVNEEIEDEDELAPFSFSTPSPHILLNTMKYHPLAQCRLDTYFQGALCVSGNCKLSMGQKEGVRPNCWHKQEGFLSSIDTNFSAPAFGDVNGDGLTDIVLGGEDGTLRYLERNAEGFFVEKTGSENPFNHIDCGRTFNTCFR